MYYHDYSPASCAARPTHPPTHALAQPSGPAPAAQVAHVLSVMRVPEERAALQGAMDEEEQGLLDDDKRAALQAAGVDTTW